MNNEPAQDKEMSEEDKRTKSLKFDDEDWGEEEEKWDQDQISFRVTIR